MGKYNLMIDGYDADISSRFDAVLPKVSFFKNRDTVIMSGLKPDELVSLQKEVLTEVAALREDINSLMEQAAESGVQIQNHRFISRIKTELMQTELTLPREAEKVRNSVFTIISMDNEKDGPQPRPG